MKKTTKKQPKPKSGPVWKDPNVAKYFPKSKVVPSKNNPNYSMVINEDGSRMVYSPWKKQGDTAVSTSGRPISSINRPAPKPKPVKDTITSYTNHGPLGTFDRGNYVEKIKPISQNPNSKVNKTKGTKSTTKPIKTNGKTVFKISKKKK